MSSWRRGDTKWSLAVIENVKGLTRMNVSLTSLANHLGVTRQCVTNWRKKHPAFDAAVKELLIENIRAK